MELHSPSAEENCLTANARSLRSVKVATPPCAANAATPCGLAVCKQYKMLFAASKFELYAENNPPYDCRHTEDSLFYRHCPICRPFFFSGSLHCMYWFPGGMGVELMIHWTNRVFAEKSPWFMGFFRENNLKSVFPYSVDFSLSEGILWNAHI